MLEDQGEDHGGNRAGSERGVGLPGDWVGGVEFQSPWDGKLVMR